MLNADFSIQICYFQLSTSGRGLSTVLATAFSLAFCSCYIMVTIQYTFYQSVLYFIIFVIKPTIGF